MIFIYIDEDFVFVQLLWFILGSDYHGHRRSCLSSRLRYSQGGEGVLIKCTFNKNLCLCPSFSSLLTLLIFSPPSWTFDVEGQRTQLA